MVVLECLLFAVLASWFRLKYPHIAIGALASSAPILQFDRITPSSSFYDAISQDYKVLIFLKYNIADLYMHACILIHTNAPMHYTYEHLQITRSMNINIYYKVLITT
jgi:hypothetical protein